MPYSKSIKVGKSNWIILPAKKSFIAAREAIKRNPQITRCKDSNCIFCHDAVAGGPVLEKK